MDTTIHNDRTIFNLNSDIWHTVLSELATSASDKLSPDDIAAKSGTNIHRVRRVLREMSSQDWVEWPVDEDGAVAPGGKATEYLDKQV